MTRENENLLQQNKQEHETRYRRIILALLIAFLGSTWFTTKGMLEKSIEAGVMTTEGALTSTIAALVAAVLIGTGTMVLFSIAMTVKKSQRRSIWISSLILLPFILTISTYFSVLGTSGSASLIYFMRDHAISWEKYYQAMTADSAMARTSRETLVATQTQICQQAQAEKNHGALSGSAGRGTTYSAYEGGCQSVKTILETLENTASRNMERSAFAKTILAKLHGIPKQTDLNVFERQAAFSEELTLLNDLIKQSGEESLSKRLQAQLTILENSVFSLGDHSTAFAKRQSHAIDNLKSMLGTVTQTLKTMLASQTETPKPPRAIPEMGEAVLLYWKRNLPQIMLAVMMDLMMFYFLFQLSISRKSTESDDMPPPSGHFPNPYFITPYSEDYYS